MSKKYLSDDVAIEKVIREEFLLGFVQACKAFKVEAGVREYLERVDSDEENVESKVWAKYIFEGEYSRYSWGDYLSYNLERILSRGIDLARYPVEAK